MEGFARANAHGQIPIAQSSCYAVKVGAFRRGNARRGLNPGQLGSCPIHVSSIILHGHDLQLTVDALFLIYVSRKFANGQAVTQGDGIESDEGGKLWLQYRSLHFIAQGIGTI